MCAGLCSQTFNLRVGSFWLMRACKINSLHGECKRLCALCSQIFKLSFIHASQLQEQGSAVMRFKLGRAWCIKVEGFEGIYAGDENHFRQHGQQGRAWRVRLRVFRIGPATDQCPIRVHYGMQQRTADEDEDKGSGTGKGMRRGSGGDT